MAESLEIQDILKVWGAARVDHLSKPQVLQVLIELSDSQHFPTALLDFYKDDQANGQGLSTAAVLGYIAHVLLGDADTLPSQDWPPYHPDLVIAQVVGKLTQAQLVALLTFATQYLGQRAGITPDAVFEGLEAAATLLEAGQPLEKISDQQRAFIFTESDE